MRNHLHPLMKRLTSWNNAKPLAVMTGWVADLGLWSGLNNRVKRGLKPWGGWGRLGLRRDFLKRLYPICE